MSNDLTPYRIDLAIVRETADRIINDFNLFGIDIKFSGNEANAYVELMGQLIPAIENMLSNNSAKFMNVLYRIDISEKKLNSAISENPSKTIAEIVSRMIIEREMQKVITRKLFKK